MRSIADWNVVLDRITQSLNASLDKITIPAVVTVADPPVPRALQILDDRLGGLQKQLDLAQALADEGDRNGAERVKAIQDWLELLHQNKERLNQALQAGARPPGMAKRPG